MTLPAPLNLIPRLYHFTDRRNLVSIRECGGLFPIAVLKEHGIAVPAPGGNDWSQDADQMKGMDGYVHLCFRDNHPMEYLARQDGRIQESIFLQIDPRVLLWDGVLFAPGVSNKADATFHTIEEAKAMIDFTVLYTRTDWNDPAIKVRLQQAEKCEILVPLGIPTDLIGNLP